MTPCEFGLLWLDLAVRWLGRAVRIHFHTSGVAHGAEHFLKWLTVAPHQLYAEMAEGLRCRAGKKSGHVLESPLSVRGQLFTAKILDVPCKLPLPLVDNDQPLGVIRWQEVEFRCHSREDCWLVEISIKEYGRVQFAVDDSLSQVAREPDRDSSETQLCLKRSHHPVCLACDPIIVALTFGVNSLTNAKIRAKCADEAARDRAEHFEPLVRPRTEDACKGRAGQRGCGRHEEQCRNLQMHTAKHASSTVSTQLAALPQVA